MSTLAEYNAYRASQGLPPANVRASGIYPDIPTKPVTTSNQGSSSPANSYLPNYTPPQINTNSIISPILSGQVNPNNISSYISQQVKGSFNNPNLSSVENEDMFLKYGQPQIQSILGQISGKDFTYGTDTYNYSGGQAVKKSTTTRTSTTTPTGTTVTKSSYTGPSIVDYLNSTGQASDYNTRAQLAKTYGIANYVGSAAQNTQLLNTLRSQANQPNTSQITNPVTAPTTGGTTPAPTLPNGQAPSYMNDYTQSLNAQIASYQSQIQAEADKRTAEYQKQIDDLNNQMSEYQTLQENGLAGINQATQEEMAQKRAALELEKQRFDENYNANQQLVTEMNGLLTTGNQVIAQMKETTGLTSIMQPRIAQTMSDVTARAGVIQAVLAARSGQMTQAQNQLGTTFDAVSSIYKDQIDYYTTLIDFYTQQKSETGTKLLNLTKDQKQYLDVKINLLNSKLAQLEETKNIISKAMIDPETAKIYGNAGITLNDSPEQINQKLTTYTYSQEVKDLSNKMATDGYTQVPIAGVTPVTITDSSGVAKKWYKIPTVKTGTGGTSGTKLTSADRQLLLSSGLTNSDINNIESDVNQYGVQKVVEGITNTAQKNAILKAYGGAGAVQDTTQFLTPEYIAGLYTDNELKAAAADAGYRSWYTFWSTEKPKYLTYLQDQIESYRKAGYTDKQILGSLNKTIKGE